MTPCKHRGSQRRANCCDNKLISRWICRARQTTTGEQMDCVETELASQRHKEMAPSAYADVWDAKVAVCENCPLYTPK